MQILILNLFFHYIILVLSISFHQSMQAGLSACLGDLSAKNAGRLTLNPLKHYDFHGFILSPVIAGLYILTGMPAELFGWGRKLPFHQEKFKHPKYAPFAIGLIGLASYALLSQCFTYLPSFIRQFLDSDYGIFILIQKLCSTIVSINTTLLFINTIPFPRLDAALLIAPILPKHLKTPFLNLARFEAVFILVFCMCLLGLMSLFN